MQRLSFANLYATSRHFDFSEAHNSETGEPGYSVQYPTPSADDLDEYWPEWREECADAAEDEDERLDHARDIFDAADRFGEWQEAHEPMMNFLWSVDLPYKADPEAIATALHEAGIAITLVELPEDWRGNESYAFALTGGGMNLAWHIAGAYVLAGECPPFQLLEDLPRPCDVSDALRDRIVDAARQAADAMRHRADRLAETVAAAAAFQHG